ARPHRHLPRPGLGQQIQNELRLPTRRPGEDRDPCLPWIPAFAGMTMREARSLFPRQRRTSVSRVSMLRTTMADTTAGEFPIWHTPEGEKVSCVEKIKVLNENLAELRALAQDALEDAVLMGCDERQVREVL